MGEHEVYGLTWPQQEDNGQLPSQGRALWIVTTSAHTRTHARTPPYGGPDTEETGEAKDLHLPDTSSQRDRNTQGPSGLTWGFRGITCIGWAMAMRKHQGKTIATVSHVSHSAASHHSITKFQIKDKNGHGLNETKHKDILQMKQNNKTCA